MDDDLQRALKEAEEDHQKILRGQCPECDTENALTRKCDDRQTGIRRNGSAPCDLWYNYKCTKCGYFFDQLLPPEN